jgi:hypothetical protein
MRVAHAANDGRGDGLAEGEERAHGAAEQDDVVAVVDGAGEGVFVGVEGGEDAGEESVGGGDLEVAVEFEEFGEEGEDEGEGDLGNVREGVYLFGWRRVRDLRGEILRGLGGLACALLARRALWLPWLKIDGVYAGGSLWDWRWSIIQNMQVKTFGRRQAYLCQTQSSARIRTNWRQDTCAMESRAYEK